MSNLCGGGCLSVVSALYEGIFPPTYVDAVILDPFPESDHAQFLFKSEDPITSFGVYKVEGGYFKETFLTTYPQTEINVGMKEVLVDRESEYVLWIVKRQPTPYTMLSALGHDLWNAAKLLLHGVLRGGSLDEQFDPMSVEVTKVIYTYADRNGDFFPTVIDIDALAETPDYIEERDLAAEAAAYLADEIQPYLEYIYRETKRRFNQAVVDLITELFPNLDPKLIGKIAKIVPLVLLALAIYLLLRWSKIL